MSRVGERRYGEPMSTTIRAMTQDDAVAVLRIYDEGAATGHATFQERAPDWAEWDAEHLPHCRLVAVADDAVSGWVALARVSPRHVYRGFCEVSVYVAAAARGRGIGRMLLDAVVAESERQGIWTLQAGIFPENEASIAVHRAAGFRVVGTHERLGFMSHGPMAGQWRDVIMMERRSGLIGGDIDG